VRSWQATYRGLLPQSVLDALDAAKRGEYWQQYLSEAARPGETVLVAEEDGMVVGFASVGPSRDEDANETGEVRAIYLLADRWGRGIGWALMDTALNTLCQAGYTQATLWVLDTKHEPANSTKPGVGHPTVRPSRTTHGASRLRKCGTAGN
jgi:L-amino acid N-acyltransferase YncA